jgi:hypothetical protein
VFFHELPGDNYPIFSRYFWIDTLNRGVIRKLAGLADVIVTNTADHVTKIQKISGRTDVHFIPVGSNIEPVAHGSESRAETEFAILGLPFGRWQTLQTFDREIPRWHRNGQLTKLHLIGPIDEKFDSRSERLIAAWPERGFVIRHGLLAPAEISALLSKLQFSLTNVTLENWSKSSAFMAYAVHNCAIVSRAKCDLVPLCFTIAPSELTKAGNVDLMARANALQKWYQENADWNITAKKVAALLHGHLPQEALS